MEKLKSILFSIFILLVLSFLGYWAFTSMESGSEHATNQELRELKDKNLELEGEILNLKEQIRVLSLQKDNGDVKEEIKEEPKEEVKEEVKTPTYKYQELINSLQGLVDRKVFLKLNSKGADVGVVQKFLNVYNGTSARIDNDFGSKTVTQIKAFQKSVGLSQDGQVGTTTLNKMITWLKNQK